MHGPRRGVPRCRRPMADCLRDLRSLSVLPCLLASYVRLGVGGPRLLRPGAPPRKTPNATQFGRISRLLVTTRLATLRAVLSLKTSASFLYRYLTLFERRVTELVRWPMENQRPDVYSVSRARPPARHQGGLPLAVARVVPPRLHRLHRACPVVYGKSAT